jgi:uncharacterized protein YcaQ
VQDEAVAPIPLARDAARRFLVTRHLLAPPRSLPARAESVLAAVERLGSLQFDPLEVPGARNHELVLHARVRGFRREWLWRWLYGPPARRRLFEAWNKGLSILPTAELRYHRTIWDVAATRYAGFLATHGEVARRILSEIETHGARATQSFGRGAAIDWWWGKTALNRAVIDVLFLCGRLGIARRDGNLRVYDLIGRLLPAPLLAQRAGPDEARRHRLLSRVRGVGLLGETVSAELVGGLGTALQRRADLAALVDAGVLAEVALEGARGRAWMLAAEVPLLAARRAAGRPQVTFVAPLDPLVWDRRLVRLLWDFEYLWEVYTPAAKRRWGYYVLPVLFGERLVGRIEPRLERAAGTLEIAGLSLEDGVDPDERGLAPAFAAALAAYAEFVGARDVVFARGLRGTARALAARLAKLSAPRRRLRAR